ncbi:MAG: DEAD/DEAH box helicase [candidate division NC10 bacterium]|nr:DEAD/DEAH box helicase [candidate division NC10 bacterium]
MESVILKFDAGVLILEGLEGLELAPFVRQDPRTGEWVAPAYRYLELVTFFSRRGIPFQDCAQSYNKDLNLRLSLNEEFRPYDYQIEALECWLEAGGRGTVILPTGAGKTYVALKAIEATSRSTLVVAPTIALMHQWYRHLARAFSIEVGILGGGEHQVKDITVTTYESAYRQVCKRYGNRFGLLVFDEVHNLPTQQFSHIPEMTIAPFRLGLTATYEREDGAHRLLGELLGRVVYRRTVSGLRGVQLSDYDTVLIRVELTPEERQEYESQSQIYFAFLRKNKLNPYLDWDKFIKLHGQDPEARQAGLARGRMLEIVAGAQNKMFKLGELLRRHAVEQTLIFTRDNASVYRISREFLVPAITHQTKALERKEILDRFASGEYRAMVASDVLNEGIDVPGASVAIIFGGDASQRKHIQRLGRILRRKKGKFAVLYEIITRNTLERTISWRRRQVEAYRGLLVPGLSKAATMVKDDLQQESALLF